MYHKLQAEPGLSSGYLKQQNNKHETLLRGTLVDETELELPWRYIANVSEEHGLALSDFYPGARVMSKRLVDTLQRLGVENLQTFPAEITNDVTGAVLHDHVVFNIVGMVSAADAAASVSMPLADV